MDRKIHDTMRDNFLFYESIPEVSVEEQNEIDEIHGEPEGYQPVYSQQVER